MIPVIPCNETFLLPTSTGTRKYKRATKAKFRGCYPLEEKLLANREVRHEPFDNLSAMQEWEVTEDSDESLVSDSLVTTLDKILSRHSMNIHAAHYQQNEDEWTDPESIELESTESGLIEAELPLSQSSIWDDSNTFKKSSVEIKMHLHLLTPKQREAVQMVYLNEKNKLSGPEVAKKLKISIDSLKDRLKGALGRIRKATPEFNFSQRRRPPQKDKNENDKKLNTRNGPYPVKILDPHSFEVKHTIHPEDFKKLGFGKKKKNPKAKVIAIKKWILEKVPPLKFN